MALTGYMMVTIPKGFFPIQDIGLINGVSEGAQDTSPQQLMRLHQELGEVLLRDPAIEAFGSTVGSTTSAKTANNGNFTIVLKPREERDVTASQVIDRLRPQLAKIIGVNLFLQPAQDITVGGRILPRRLSIHVAGSERRRTERVVEKAVGQDAHLARADRRCQRSVGRSAAAQGDDQSRSGLAVRHFTAGHRRHAQRRLWTTPDRAIFHAAQYLLVDPGDTSGPAA